MENFNFSKHTSAPPVSENNVNKRHPVHDSSVTHPSVGSRNRDHLENIFQKIISGDNVLSRIPMRLDPNIEFSDDEEEESAATVIDKLEVFKSNDVQSKENSKKIITENIQTPELPSSLRSAYNDGIYSLERKDNSSKIRSNENIFSGCFSASKVDFKTGNYQSQNRKPLAIHKDSSFVLPKLNFSTVLPDVPQQKSSDLLHKNVDQNDNSSNITKNVCALPNDIIKVNKKVYNVLSLLGSGGSCKVYSVYDVQDKLRVAIKRVDLKDTDPLIRKGYEQEIEYLQKLQNSNRVIKMYDFEYRENELLLVLEHGDIDFAKYLSNEAKLKRLTPLKIKFYWVQMLEAVADIHKYGIIHSDLKPANFLLVAGNLKLIDFGIAASIPEDKTSTFRDIQVGTLNYMSPEAITQKSADSKQPCFKVGVKSDVWSLGCILYNLVYGFTPFFNIKSLIQKIYAITNPNYEIPFNPLSDPLLLDVLKSCLKRNPKERASVEELLKHPYLSEDNNASTNTVPVNSNPDLQNVLKQMQIFTPNRMRYIRKVVQELSEKSNV